MEIRRSSQAHRADGAVAAGAGAPRIFFVAGDVSGEQNAGRLAGAIRTLCPGARLYGAGGETMRGAGVEVLVETADLGFVGVLDSLHIMRRLVGVFRKAQRLIEATDPDLVVLVDSEFVTMPAAFWLRRRRVPVVFYYPPQAWLWGRWRLPAMVPLARRFISAFRAEAELYRSAGADAVWTGHPLRDIVRRQEDPRALEAIGLDPARPLVVLMPGSRKSEVTSLLAAMLGAARRLRERDPSLQFAIPLASDSLRADVERAVAESGLSGVAVYAHESYAVLSRARVVVQCSGTATLETALLGIPSVIVYRCRPIEHFVGRRVMNVDYIGMVNILLGEMVQPEFFNVHVDAEHIAAEAWSLLTDERRRQFIRRRLAEIESELGPPGALLRAARAVLEVLPAYEGALPDEMALAVGGEIDAVRQPAALR